MELEPPPSGFAPLGEQAAWADLDLIGTPRQVLRIVPFAFCAILVLLLGLLLNASLFVLIPVSTIGICWGIVVNWRHHKFNRAVSTAGKWIAVAEGHPWNDCEELSTAPDVAIVTVPKGWVILPADRISLNPQPVSAGWEVRRGDRDGELVGMWPEATLHQDLIPRMLSVVNMAIILRDAQNRDEEAEDPLEEARQREEDEEAGLLERTWESTTPGQLVPDPGVLLRGRSVKVAKKREK
jgi:hypothetical protein